MYNLRMFTKRSLRIAMKCSAIFLCANISLAQNNDTEIQQQQLEKLSSLIDKNSQIMDQLNSVMKQNNNNSAEQSKTTMSDTKEEKASSPPQDQSSSQSDQTKQSSSDNQKQGNGYWSSYESELGDSAFQSVKQTAFPLTPQQIEQMHNMLDDTQRAVASEPYNIPPHPTSSSLLVNLSPGSVPPVIRLARGFVSSLVFIDSTGAPWPIQAYDLGNPQAFNIKWNQKDNTLMVQATSSYTYGNIAVVLEGLDTPVMLTLVPGQKVVDYRVDLRVQGMGPKAKLDVLQSNKIPEINSPQLLNVLDGIPPQNGKRLTINGGSGQAWLSEDKIYLRTRYNVISPAWLAKMSSADGMNAYELPVTPVVLLSHYGKTVPIKITGL